MTLTKAHGGKFQVPEGLIGGSGIEDAIRNKQVIGFNSAVGATDEALWDGSGVFNYRTGAAALEFSSSDAKDTGFAEAILTLSGNITDGETVTIDSKVYTFEDELTEVDGNVHIGVAATNTIDNLIDAINLGAGGGTDYATATTLHPTVTGAVGAGDTMLAKSKFAQDTFPTDEASGTASWGGNGVLGVGVQSVEIFGMDVSYNEVNEIVNLDGELEVATTNSYLKVFEVQSRLVGSEDDNAGDIYVSTGGVTAGVPDDTTQIWAKILAGRGKTLAGVYTTPDGWTGYISKASFNAGLTGTQHLECKIIVKEENESYYILDQGFATREGGKLVFDYSDAAKPIPPRTDIELRALASAGAPGLRGSLSLFLIQDVDVNTK